MIPIAGLVGVAALVTVVSALAGASRPGSPISIVEIESGTKSRLGTATVVARAVGIIGVSTIDVTTAKLVQYEDRASFGPFSSGTGWLLRADVRLSNEVDVVQLDLNVIIDDQTNCLVAAYTNPSDSWVPPVLESPSLDEILQSHGWNMGPEIPDSMVSTVADALSAAWKNEGLSPTQVGQLIARPRWISAQFPARFVNGEVVPIRPTERVWIIQVCGTKTSHTRTSDGDQYYSGRVVQLLDGTLEFAWGFPMP